MNNLTPKAYAESLMKKMLQGQEVHNTFAESFKKQILVSGKTIDHWREKFYLHIPTDNLTPARCMELAMKIMALAQEVTFHLNVAQAKSQLLKRGFEATYNAKFWEIVQEFKDKGTKLPASATLETMAKINTEEVASAETIAAVELKFWKDMQDHLNMCRKLIENATLNISVEIKAMNNEKWLENINKKQ